MRTDERICEECVKNIPQREIEAKKHFLFRQG